LDQLPNLGSLASFFCVKMSGGFASGTRMRGGRWVRSRLKGITRIKGSDAAVGGGGGRGGPPEAPSAGMPDSRHHAVEAAIRGGRMAS
jgi:hypothetical protein